MDPRVNLPIRILDVTNFGWAVLGSFLNLVLTDPKSSGGAISNCVRDYGINTDLMVISFHAVGWM